VNAGFLPRRDCREEVVMSVEASVFAQGGALTLSELLSTAGARHVQVRLTDADGKPMATAPVGPLAGDFVVIAWPDSATDVTAAVDRAIDTRDKDALDELGRAGRLAWCGLSVKPFDYEAFWSKYAGEREEYEESVDPDELASIRAARTRYSLRSAVRPVQNARLVETLSAMLAEATGGVVE
jgi:hypothetical protein